MIPKDYICDGQLTIWDFVAEDHTVQEYEHNLQEVETDNSICEHSHHKCNCEELWAVAEADGIECNRCCCIGCAVQFCGARCNGSSEPQWEHPPVDPDVASGKKKPYEYDFERFIGQKVWCYLSGEDEPKIGEIIDFDHYYTEVKINYEYFALTCRDVKPCTLPKLKETIKQITKKYGLEFETYHGEWNLPDNPTIYKHVFKKNSYLEISEGHYFSARGRGCKGARYIAVDWEGWHESVSRPCDDIAEICHAVEYSIYRNEHSKKPRKGEVEND